MNMEKAIKEGTTMKFKPPKLELFLYRLKGLDELFKAQPEGEIEFSVEAVAGFFNLLTDIGDEIIEFADKEIGGQIDDAPEPAMNPEDLGKPGDTMEEYQAIMILKENEGLLSKVAKAQKSGLDVEEYLDNFISADELGLGAQDRFPLVDSI